MQSRRQSTSRSSVSHPDSTSTSAGSETVSAGTHEKLHTEQNAIKPSHARPASEKPTLEPLSPRPSHHRDPESLRRTESHHSQAGADGYTWHEGSGTGARTAAPVVEEPYLVAFDGDADPECPRSMSSLRRWAVVLICASSSLCV
jgi:hypothetical protein